MDDQNNNNVNDKSSNIKKTEVVKSHETIRTLNINFQSALPKKVELWQLIDSYKPQIIFGTETWLRKEINTTELFPNELGFEVFRKDREDGHGGVLLAIKKELNPQELNIDTNAEATFATIKSGKNKLTIASVYRTNKTNTRDQMNEIAMGIKSLNKNDIIWIAGDINLPDIDWKAEKVNGHQYPTSINQFFIESIRDAGLTQINSLPTRGNNILDIFLTNRPNLVIDHQTLPGLGDHDVLLVDTRIRAEKIKRQPHKVTIWKKANINALKEETKQFSSAFIKNTPPDVEDMWTAIHSHLTKMMNTHIPTKTCSNKFNQPWINTKLKRLSRRKQRAWSRAKSSNSQEHWIKYNEIKKETRKENRSAYQKHLKNIFQEDQNNKKLWKFIKHKRCDPVGVPSLLEGTTLFPDNKDKANILNKQFCSVFVTENSSNSQAIPPLDKPTQIMPNITITEKGVEKLLSNLKADKAAGPDEIPPRLLKMLAPELSPALTKLFELSLRTGNVPKIWKHAIVQPIYKKGDRKLPCNYRPISLTSICCKIMEHIIRSSITNHLESNNILTNAQHGFRKHRSCETQLLGAVHDFTSQLDRGGQTDVVFMDFAKAFDKVPHQRLLAKLEMVGINTETTQWIRSFLDQRTQEVVVGGERSSIGKVTSGVPQGSVLGPLLFLIYINDLPNKLKSNVCLFADDTMLYRNIKTEKDCEILNEDLKSLEHWEQNWLMEFNVSKCHILSITNKRKPISYTYELHNQTLERVDSAKYLGVELTGNMKWGKHIANITSRANKICAFIHRNLRGSATSTQVHCYRTLARPILEYANVVWDPHLQQDIEGLEMVQRRAARRITNDFSRHTSASNLVRTLGLDTLQRRRKRDKVNLFHKVYNQNIAIEMPKEIQKVKRKTRGHNNKLIPPSTRTDSYQNSFFPSAIKQWNNLPDDIAEIESYEHFSRLVKFCT